MHYFGPPQKRLNNNLLITKQPAALKFAYVKLIFNSAVY